MTHPLLTLLALVALAAFLSPTPPAATASTPRLTFPDYFPLTPGGVYVYRDNDTDDHSWEFGRFELGQPSGAVFPARVLQVDEPQDTDGTLTNINYYSSDSKTGLQFYGVDEYYGLDHLVCTERYQPAYLTPNLDQGKRSTQTGWIVSKDEDPTDIIDCNNSRRPYTFTTTFAGLEPSVKVPAGTFQNCAKIIQVETSVDDDGKLGSNTVISYLARGVGPVKSVNAAAGVVQELVSFTGTTGGFTINVTTFIPANSFIGPDYCHCCGPQSPGEPLYFRGDDRSFDANATSYRSRHLVTVIPEQSIDPDGYKEGSDTPLTGISKHYAPDALDDGKITDQDDDAQLYDCHLLHDRGQADTTGMKVTVTRTATHSVRAEFRGKARDPLLLSAFINWHFIITLDTSGPQTRYTIEGDHDGFPAYEVYINNEPVYGFTVGRGPYTWDDIKHLFGTSDVKVPLRQGFLP